MLIQPTTPTLKKNNLTKESWHNLLKSQDYKCSKCGSNFPTGKCVTKENSITCYPCVLNDRQMSKDVKERNNKIENLGEFKCLKCDIIKPFSDFPKTKRHRRSGLPIYKYCKPCHYIAQREIRLKKLFNISVQEYDTILAFQGGVCFICKQPPKKVKLAVDHCHKTGLIRGLLCMFCNRAISLFRDDLERFKNVISYLENPPTTQALKEEKYGLKGRVSNKASTRDKLNKKDMFQRPKEKT